MPLFIYQVPTTQAFNILNMSDVMDNELSNIVH